MFLRLPFIKLHTIANRPVWFNAIQIVSFGCFTHEGKASFTYLRTCVCTSEPWEIRENPDEIAAQIDAVLGCSEVYQVIAQTIANGGVT